jgi:hypothetical protein
MDIKNIIIFLIIFVIILWLQHNDDIKNNVKRNNLYDKIKIPLVSALFVILLKQFDFNKFNSFFESFFIPKITINKTDIGQPNSDIFFQNNSNYPKMLNTPANF